MGDHDDRGPVAVQLLDQGHDLRAGRTVEVAGRLVGEHDRWRADERARDRDPLPLAARELGRACLQPGAEADRGQRVCRFLTTFRCWNACVEEPVGDVVEDARVLAEEELLEDEADPGRPNGGELAVFQLGDGEAGDRDPATGRPLERPHQVEEGRLAGAGGADDGHELAGADAEANALQRCNPWADAIDLRHLLELEYRQPLRMRERCGHEARRLGGHEAGTTTRWPTVRPLPATCTSPCASSNKPGVTATRR